MQIVSVPEIPFDNRDPLYECCAGTCHIKNGAIALCGAIALLMLSELAAMLILQMYASYVVAVTIVPFLCEIFTGGLMLIGIWKARPEFLIPQLVYLVAVAGYAVFMFVLLVTMAIFPRSVGHSFFLLFFDYDLSISDVTISAIVNACLMFVELLLSVWALRICYQCYGYLKIRELDHR